VYFFTERAGCSGEIRKEVTDCSERSSAGIIAKRVSIPPLWPREKSQRLRWCPGWLGQVWQSS